MTTTKEEVLAAGLRKQIAYLEGLLEELGNDPEPNEQLLLKIRQVEEQLHKLRSQL